MKKPLAKLHKLKDPGRGLILAAGLLLVVAKLVLASAQNVYLTPNAAPVDDMLLYDAAVSITKGNWLGDYGWKTLSKYSFFSLWLAGLHSLGIPYLLGGQLLWAAAAFAAAWALCPALKNRWLQLALFAVLLFSPSSTANPASPAPFVTRVYRDNIFPALCLLCVAGMAGAALRLWQRQRHSLGWLALAGVSFAAAWLCREDGWWMLFFVGAAAVVMALFLVGRARASRAEKLKRAAALLLPFGLLAAGLLGWAAANNAAYGRFVISDFTTGAFADAYGAMTRIEHKRWDPKVDVPEDVRRQLYAAIPAFAPLEPLLESESYLGRYAGWTEENPDADYTSGAFYWALREAAAELGHYDSPQASEAFFAALAADINRACDAGALAAGPARSSVNPPIRAAYIGPVTAEAFKGLGLCLTFGQCQPASLWSPASNDPVFYAEEIAPMEDFLHEKALTATQAGSTQPYHSPWQRLCFGVLEGIRFLYAAAAPLALCAALVWQVLAVVWRRRSPVDWMLWTLQLGLLLCVILRAFMIAYVTVSSFTIGTYVMYLASIHPLLLLFCFVGAVQLAGLRPKRPQPGREAA